MQAGDGHQVKDPYYLPYAVQWILQKVLHFFVLGATMY